MSGTALTEAFVAISQVKARYCRTLDAKDWEAFAQLFTEDLVLELPQVEILRGRDKALAFIQKALAGARTAHQVHLPEIELDGDEARVIWAMQDRNTWDPPRGGVSIQRGYGQYHERYVRINGEWKIAAQRLVYLHLDTE
jgi:uncharacterized protein (TIGR02246 family)